MFDIIIIGSGIAGLHCAYKLQNHTKNICILEKDCRIGGRIFTVTKDGARMEAGAGRFNQKHKLLHQLIHDLGLEQNKIEIASDIVFRPSLNNKNSTKYSGKNPFDILEPVFEKGLKTSTKILQNQTFIEYAQNILSKSDAEFVLDSFGYYEQLVHMNAFDALKLFKDGMHTDNTFYSMKTGLSSITEELCNKIDVPIYTNREVYKIDYDDSLDYPFQIYTNERKTCYPCKHCICAIPKLAANKLSLFKPLTQTMNCVGIKILCRIYAKFDKKDIWFRDIPKTTTNNNNRYIIPIDRENGLIMIAYADSIYAKKWKGLSKTEMVSQLKKNIKDTFGISIATPSFVQAFYWETGTAFWKPGCDSKELSHKMLQPLDSIPVYVCGENFSETQGWMEGALETSTQVIQKVLSHYKL